MIKFITFMLINLLNIFNLMASPVEIIENALYLSNATDAQDLNELRRLGITHIVNLTGYKNNGREDELRFPNPFPGIFKEGQNYLHIKISDEMDTNIIKFFSKINKEFIHPAIKKAGKVLVHCEAGISRSSTVVISYLMQAKRMSLKDAYDLVKGKKENIGPNKQFMAQLITFERRLTLNPIATLGLREYLTDQLFETINGAMDKAHISELLEKNDDDPNHVMQIIFN